MIGGMNQSFRRQGSGWHEVCRLAFGVHARVRTPRTDDDHSLAEKVGERDFEAFLYGHGVGLPLPAGVAAAVVGDREAKNVAHGSLSLLRSNTDSSGSSSSCHGPCCQRRTKNGSQTAAQNHGKSVNSLC